MLEPVLPEEIKLIYSDDLYREYPDLTPKERENAAAKKYGAIFIAGIGGKLPDGSIHDGRAPDYDDWISDAGDGHVGLNGDLIVWDSVLGRALELSSMGIRVVPESLRRQLEERGCPEREKLSFHSRLLNGEFVPTLGGGIGLSTPSPQQLLHRLRFIFRDTQPSDQPHGRQGDCQNHDQQHFKKSFHRIDLRFTFNEAIISSFSPIEK